LEVGDGAGGVAALTGLPHMWQNLLTDSNWA
jgi:hypothetical protein